MKHYKFIVLLGIGAFSSFCTQKDEVNIPVDISGEIIFNCSMGDGETRAFVNNNGTHVYWNADDSIKVFKGPDICGKFLNQSAKPSMNASFKGSMNNTTGRWNDEPFLGVYPYSSVTALASEGVSLSVPENQEAVPGSFSPDAFPSVGESTSCDISFYNVCGGLRFKLSDSGINSITFEGNNGETLAGDVIVKLDAQGHPEVVRTVRASSKVTMECESAFDTGVWYYMSMLPVPLTAGFSITLTRGSESVTYYSDRASEVQRSIFGQIAGFDEGLPFDSDWRTNDFVHKSLLLCFPNCAFPSVIVQSADNLINSTKELTCGNTEVALMLANGPEEDSKAIGLLTSLQQNTLPFYLSDYRMSVSKGDESSSAYQRTAALYGTVTGTALKTYFEGNELNIAASLHFKKSGEYRLVIMVVHEGTAYPFTYNSGSYSATLETDCRVRYYVTDVTGDAVSVGGDNLIIYRKYQLQVAEQFRNEKLRVLAYVLRPYGSRTVESNGNYGSYYVDNAISVRAGKGVGLSTKVEIESEISSYYDGGEIEL